LYQTNKTEINWRFGSSPNGFGYQDKYTPTDPSGNGISSAPEGRIDGKHLWEYGATSDHAGSLTSAVISSAQAQPSAFSVTMNRAWNSNCTAVNLTVTIQATSNFTATGSLKFRTVMVERVIHFSSPPGSNGETHFEDVAIKSFPTIQAGIPMAGTWQNGQTQTFTLSCEVPVYTRKKEEIAMVGFIQDDGNKRIEQAVRADKMPVPAEALSAISAKVDLTLQQHHQS
jgi:hypothetical protein